MTQSELLLKALNLVVKSGLWPETTPGEWIKILLYLHTRGWLYFIPENNDLAVVIAGYRVPEVGRTTHRALPTKEEGKIFYVPFMVSIAKDKREIAKVIRRYMRAHADEIEEVALETTRNGKDHLKRFKNRGVKSNGKQQGKTELTANPDVSGGTTVQAGVYRPEPAGNAVN